MTHPARHIALALAVTLAGCLPNINALPQGDTEQDTDLDAGQDAAPDAAPDVAPDVDPSTCPTQQNAVEWCSQRSACGDVELEGCPDVSCGDTCQDLEACVDNACVCDDAKLTRACEEAERTCGILDDFTCSASTVTCDLCTGYSVCDGLRECVTPNIEIAPEFRDVNLLRLGTSLAYHEDTLLIGSFGVGGGGRNAASLFHVDLSAGTTDVVNRGVIAAEDSNLFGHSIDITGDHAIVGAVGEGPIGPANGLGVARAFQFVGGSWEPFSFSGEDNAIYNTSDDDTSPSGGQFSESVAVDYPIFAAGAPRFSPDQTSNAPGRVRLWRYDAEELVEFPVDEVNPEADDNTFTNANYGQSLELRDGMLFVGAPKANQVGTNVRCGLVRVLELGEGKASVEASHDIYSPDCEGDAADARTSFFGASILSDGEHLFVSAPAFAAGDGPGAVYVFRIVPDAPTLAERFVYTQTLSLPGVAQQDRTLRMTRAGDALVIGADGHGYSTDGAGVLANEGLIYVFRLDLDPSETWVYEGQYLPDELSGTPSKFGAAVSGTPDGKLYVSAPDAASPERVDGEFLQKRGRIYELDLNRR